MDDELQSRGTREGLIGALLMRHRTALFGYIYSCVPHAADAEDIMQEIVEEAETNRQLDLHRMDSL